MRLSYSYTSFVCYVVYMFSDKVIYPCRSSLPCPFRSENGSNFFTPPKKKKKKKLHLVVLEGATRLLLTPWGGNVGGLSGQTAPSRASGGDQRDALSLGAAASGAEHCSALRLSLLISPLTSHISHFPLTPLSLRRCKATKGTVRKTIGIHSPLSFTAQPH